MPLEHLFKSGATLKGAALGSSGFQRGKRPVRRNDQSAPGLIDTGSLAGKVSFRP